MNQPIIQGESIIGRELNLIENCHFTLAIYRAENVFCVNSLKNKRLERAIFRLMNKKRNIRCKN